MAEAPGPPASALSGDGAAIRHRLRQGYDPLRDVSRAYARKLADAGNDLTYIHHPDLTHGFIQFTGHSKRCLQGACRHQEHLSSARRSGGARNGGRSSSSTRCLVVSSVSSARTSKTQPMAGSPQAVQGPPLRLRLVRA
ncbi:alpha/beta hydrolase fold domain-containing protein [Microbispora sp. NPDC046973]|uniref:alpha/beta hydrolase fold domain-containing protein n=1 Tax=Microbispora sp. NPDC046973 TaxID=3155022 RepID=UPI0033FABA65